MSRRRVLQQSPGSSPAAIRHHYQREDVVDDSPVDPAMLLPELVGHLLNEAAARVDDQAEAIRIHDGVVWKPLRHPDQVQAAGEHVSGLLELKNEQPAIVNAAAAVGNDVYPSPQSSAVRSRVVQQAAEREAPSADAATLAPEDRRVQKVAVDMAQNHPSGGSGKDAANRSGTPINRKAVPQEPKDDSKDLTATRANEERRDATEVGSPDVVHASVQAAPAEAFSGGQTKATAELSPRKRVVTADREVHTTAESSKKKSSTKDRYSQTLPTAPTLYSMATQTDLPEAPWYVFHASVEKKKLAVVVSAVFVLVYFILCYGLVGVARELYAEHIFEELDFL